MGLTAAAWVLRAMSRHAKRLSLPDVPTPGTDEFEDHAVAWERAFGRIGANQSDIDRASLDVLESPPSWWREQLPAILAAVEAERSSNPVRPDFPDQPEPADRKSAELASRTCTDCNASGFAEVFHRRHAGGLWVEWEDRFGEVRKARSRRVIYCDCPLGKWLKTANERSASNCKDTYEADRQRDAVRSMGGIEGVRAGRTDYTLTDPTMPVGVDLPIGGNWRDYVAAWAEAVRVRDREHQHA